MGGTVAAAWPVRRGDAAIPSDAGAGSLSRQAHDGQNQADGEAVDRATDRMTAMRWCLLRSGWRRSFGLQVGLVALIALTGTMVLASVAGARRTETAFDRFMQEARLPELLLSAGAGEADLSADQRAAMSELPMVAGISHLHGYALEPSGTDLYQPTAAPADDAWGRTVNVPRYVEGRAPQAADEISLQRKSFVANTLRQPAAGGRVVGRRRVARGHRPAAVREPPRRVRPSRRGAPDPVAPRRLPRAPRDHRDDVVARQRGPAAGPGHRRPASRRARAQRGRAPSSSRKRPPCRCSGSSWACPSGRSRGGACGAWWPRVWG